MATDAIQWGKKKEGLLKMNESDTRLKLIDPVLAEKGWTTDLIRTEYSYTDGQIQIIGDTSKRGTRKRVDYLLDYNPGHPIAVIEAKDETHEPNFGLQQGIKYAEDLHVPFAYSTNGHGFVERDFITGMERDFGMDAFPTPDELWQRLVAEKQLTPEQEKLMAEPDYVDGPRQPRYYQENAINSAIEAIAQGQKRILIVMATGTGKTFTSFQIVHRLRASGTIHKVLYLADRNVLVDQTITGDFKPFGTAMYKVSGGEMDPSHEIYFALYQQLIGQNGEERFKEFAPDFFDLIIVDECHRGSADADSQWRRVLDYYSSAIQIGMTATPKETKEVSNIDYFGEPVYTYSLKQGIEDGFLAPYKVIRVRTNIDESGYAVQEGQTDDLGNVIPSGEYSTQDFDRSLVIKERDLEVARRITEFLKATDRYAKTIVFCVDTDHAARMREALVNENADICKDHPDYVMRITGKDDDAQTNLDHFMDSDEKFPTIVTTSELLTTGVNCRTCKVIVLDNTFGEQGMTKFKQIIGRGTRIAEEYGKTYFTILDFRNASRLFADKDFDGEPVVTYEPKPNEPVLPAPSRPTPDDPAPTPEPPSGKHNKYLVHGVNVYVAQEQVQYWVNGKLITTDLATYSRDNVRGEYSSLAEFLTAWNAADRKKAILDELEDRGVFLDELRKEPGMEGVSDFDLICHFAFDQKPLTRAERARNVKQKGLLEKYSRAARDVLEALLEKFVVDDIPDLDDLGLLDIPKFQEQFGGPLPIIKAFGGKSQFLQAAQQLEDMVYAA